jgi:hypothetical protein
MANAFTPYARCDRWPTSTDTEHLSQCPQCYARYRNELGRRRVAAAMNRVERARVAVEQAESEYQRVANRRRYGKR